jgi:hypothetical protein
LIPTKHVAKLMQCRRITEGRADQRDLHFDDAAAIFAQDPRPMQSLNPENMKIVEMGCEQCFDVAVHLLRCQLGTVGSFGHCFYLEAV